MKSVEADSEPAPVTTRLVISVIADSDADLKPVSLCPPPDGQQHAEDVIADSDAGLRLMICSVGRRDLIPSRRRCRRRRFSVSWRLPRRRRLTAASAVTVAAASRARPPGRRSEFKLSGRDTEPLISLRARLDSTRSEQASRLFRLGAWARIGTPPVGRPRHSGVPASGITRDFDQFDAARGQGHVACIAVSGHTDPVLCYLNYVVLCYPGVWSLYWSSVESPKPYS